MVKLTEGMVIARTRASDLDSVRKLNCWGSELSDVTLLRKLSNVEVLSLSVNSITTLADFQCCYNLQELYIRKNNIANLNEIFYLRNLRFLRNLWLEDNPCAVGEKYRLTVLKTLPQLQKLDNIAVQPEDLDNASVHGQTLAPPFDGTKETKSSNDDEQIGDDGGMAPVEYEDDLSPSPSPPSSQMSASKITVTSEDNVHIYQTIQPQRITPVSSSGAPELQQQLGRPQTLTYDAGDNWRRTNGDTVQKSGLNGSSGSQLSPEERNDNNCYNDFTPRPASAGDELRRQQTPRRSVDEMVMSNGIPQQMMTSQTSANHYPPRSVPLTPTQEMRNFMPPPPPQQSHSAPPTHRDDQFVGYQSTPVSQHAYVSQGGCSYPAPQNQQQVYSYVVRPTGFEDYRGYAAMQQETHYRQQQQQHVPPPPPQQQQMYETRSPPLEKSSPSRPPYPVRPKHRNSNILSAILCLIKELDYASLEVVEMAVRCRMEELED